MTTNPYETPRTEPELKKPLALQSSWDRCPLCEASLQRWAVFNTVSYFRCETCGARLSLQAHWSFALIMLAILAPWLAVVVMQRVYGVWTEYSSLPHLLGITFFLVGLAVRYLFGKIVVKSSGLL